MESRMPAIKPASVNSLPLELLSIIFIIANLPLSRHFWLFADFKLVASRVCRYWRTIVDGTSALWTALPVTRGTSPDFVDYYFRRANGAAIEVCINMQSFSLMPGRVSDMRQTVELKDVHTFCDTILPVLSRHDDSIRRLLVKGDSVDDIQHFVRSFTSSGGRRLTQLAMYIPRRWMQHFTHLEPLANNELDLPPILNIKALVLAGIRFLGPTATFASLTSLHLTGLFLPVSWHLLSRALASASMLRKLVMFNINCPDCDGVAPLSLPSLEIFVFGSSGRDYDTRILKVLEFPAVSILTLRVVGGNTMSPFLPLKKVLSHIRCVRLGFRHPMFVTDFLAVARNIETLVLETPETFRTVSALLIGKALELPRLKLVEALCVVEDDVARTLVSAVNVELFAPTSLSFVDTDIFYGRERQHWYLDPTETVLSTRLTIPFVVPCNLVAAWPDVQLERNPLIPSMFV
ncbi:hypothetical protein B0H16DRAFT_1447875 [Mycena metata]|uniref:F-box domain-containing protein n=1 Tax=Mycena metata TaxID=1033252 RepID=A0AAD7KA28_9AGAR|nr:hypothetical protein B0H16DRAFT_1447875 [Mycena metata]